MKQLWKNIWPWLRNKYVVTLLLFSIWMVFFSQNNLVNRFQMASEIRKLEDEKEYYRQQIQRDSARLHELTTDKENLEKFAREQYYMKKENEDLFVILEEEED